MSKNKCFPRLFPKTQKVLERYALIVDDEPQMRSILARYFQRRGFLPLEAADNAEAMQHLQVHRPTIVTTDMYHSGGTGLELIKQVRSRSDLQRVPILFISGSASAEDRTAAKQAGASRICASPSNGRNWKLVLQQ